MTSINTIRDYLIYEDTGAFYHLLFGMSWSYVSVSYSYILWWWILCLMVVLCPCRMVVVYCPRSYGGGAVSFDGGAVPYCGSDVSMVVVLYGDRPVINNVFL